MCDIVIANSPEPQITHQWDLPQYQQVYKTSLAWPKTPTYISADNKFLRPEEASLYGW